MTPTLPTACGSLPPEGATAPAAWQSQFRGPGWAGAGAPALLFSLRTLFMKTFQDSPWHA